MNDEIEWVCINCGQPCKPIEETFNYVGTHCTNGQPGIHHTGHYVSDCCFADYEERD